MMVVSVNQSENLDLLTEFEEQCERTTLIMSDSTEILAMQTKVAEKEANGYTIMLIPGWGSIVPGWETFLSDARKDFNVIYIETREKLSSKIVKESERGSIDRLSTDLKESIKLLNLDESKLILVGSCIGANIIAHGLVNKKISPRYSYLIGPQPKWPIPKISKYILPILPKWSLTPIKPFLKMWLVKTQCDTPETAAKYTRVLHEANSRKWHHVGKPIAFDDYTDMYAKIEEHVKVVIEEGDKTHIPEDTEKIANSIKDVEIIRMKSNKAAHSHEMVEEIRKRL